MTPHLCDQRYLVRFEALWIITDLPLELAGPHLSPEPLAALIHGRAERFLSHLAYIRGAFGLGHDRTPPGPLIVADDGAAVADPSNVQHLCPRWRCIE